MVLRARAKINPANMKVLLTRVPTKGIQTMEEVIGEKIRKLPQTLMSQVRILNMFVYPVISELLP